MNAEQLRKKFPNASESFIQANLDADNQRVCPAAAKPVERMPLGGGGKTEEAHWYDAAERFEIRFIVYSTRPADYDGYDIKALQDFLVSIGIIPSDNWRTLFGGTTSRKVATEAEEKTVIQIIPQSNESHP